MTDILTKEERSVLMSKVRSSDTRPEILLRCGLHRMGFRYTLTNRHLFGNPDLVFPKFRTAIFVHGCFWHYHKGCSKASIPKSNKRFWRRKLAYNVARDKRVQRELADAGWRVIVVWECQLISNTISTVRRVATKIMDAGTGALSENPYPAGFTRETLFAVAERKFGCRTKSIRWDSKDCLPQERAHA